MSSATSATKSKAKSKNVENEDSNSELELQLTDFRGQVNAINRSQAVIEFDLDGTILNANENFLNCVGYSLDEIVGQHHRMFVESGYKESAEYRMFWADLKDGKFNAAEFKRIGKGGTEIWIHASYNPIFDDAGNPFKVVKYASDITESKMRNADYEGQLAAIGKSQATIEFDLDGTIQNANENFLSTVGYTLDEIKGKHHSMFVEAEYANSADYKEFWPNLAKGQYTAGEFLRIGKGGAEVWIQASYNPICDIDGKPFKVVKYATNITESKLQNADYEGQLAAIGKSQATIEFELDGTILAANENFLATVGYTLDEIKGKHHSMFVEAEYANSADYKEFWPNLAQGAFDAGEYLRIGKGGAEVWIQASYNPICDANGKPFKVVKYATNITESKLQNADYEGQLAAIGKSQATIEFELDGTILAANENFLATVGYSMEEIKGKHHSMFVEADYANSADYKEFWPNLAQGAFDAGEYLRIGKGGAEVWIQASYNPICDAKGKPFKVVKYATNITEAKLQNADYEGQLSAISKSQATIEFELDGTIISANENFLATVGYSMDEIKGKHHSMFVEAEYANSADYKEFWPNLAQGAFDAGEYLRIGKGGAEVWIQASYNPICNTKGKPFKVVKYATNITEQKRTSQEAARVKSMMERMAAAVVYADNDLNITYANPSAVAMFAGIQEHLPVAAANIVGQSIDIFHENPSQQRKAMEDEKNFPIDGKLEFGEEHFTTQANLILDDEGNRAGVLFAWSQVTEQVQAAAQIAESTERERAQAEELQRKADLILEMVNAAAKGDLTKTLEADGDDSVSQIAKGLNTFFGDLRQNVASIADNASALSGASEELSSVSNQMSANAEETSSQANVVTSASDEVSQNVQTTATGVEELNSAIREIAKNASDAARVSQQAVSIVDSTNTTISKLGDSSTEIGKVVKVITSIAEQTNLLALNATIEAARAGEAGKGFAVVANEVKELAKETAKATEDISHKIETIQSDTGGAVDAIQRITEVINQINDISSTIASAVEEQSATANEMGRNVAEASKGADEIAKNITSVATAAESTSQGAANSQQASSELSRMAGELQQLVSRFTY